MQHRVEITNELAAAGEVVHAFKEYNRCDNTLEEAREHHEASVGDKERILDAEYERADIQDERRRHDIEHLESVTALDLVHEGIAAG